MDIDKKELGRLKSYISRALKKAEFPYKFSVELEHEDLATRALVLIDMNGGSAHVVQDIVPGDGDSYRALADAVVAEVEAALKTEGTAIVAEVEADDELQKVAQAAPADAGDGPLEVSGTRDVTWPEPGRLAYSVTVGPGITGRVVHTTMTLTTDTDEYSLESTTNIHYAPATDDEIMELALGWVNGIPGPIGTGTGDSDGNTDTGTDAPPDPWDIAAALIARGRTREEIREQRQAKRDMRPLASNTPVFLNFKVALLLRAEFALDTVRDHFKAPYEYVKFIALTEPTSSIAPLWSLMAAARRAGTMVLENKLDTVDMEALVAAAEGIAASEVDHE